MFFCPSSTVLASSNPASSDCCWLSKRERVFRFQWSLLVCVCFDEFNEHISGRRPMSCVWARTFHLQRAPSSSCWALGSLSPAAHGQYLTNGERTSRTKEKKIEDWRKEERKEEERSQLWLCPLFLDWIHALSLSYHIIYHIRPGNILWVLLHSWWCSGPSRIWLW